MARMTRSPARLMVPNIQAHAVLEVETPGEGFTDITREAQAFLAEVGAQDGMLHVFCQHTSASLTIQENADPDVQTDLLTALRRLAPESHPWVHDMEGPDDMPAHVRTLLTHTSLTIPVVKGTAALGVWQGLYLVEHRRRPHRRTLLLTFAGQTVLDSPACNLRHRD